MDPAYLGTITPPLTYQGINWVARDAHAACNNSQFIWVLGHNVGPAQVTQLDSVFQGAQKAIRMFKLRSFLSTYVSPHGQCPKCINRVAAPNQNIAATVDKLQELHRKLDVTQPTWSQFYFPVGNGSINIFFNPTAHRLNIGYESISVSSCPNKWLNTVNVLLTDSRVTSNTSGFEQRLKLPRTRPSFVVADMGFNRAHECTLFTLWAQRSIDLPD